MQASPGSIPSAGMGKMIVGSANQTKYTFEWVYNMYKLRFLVPLHIWASKRSLKADKCVGLMDMLNANISIYTPDLL